MQIIHKINDFFFTLFPHLTADNKAVIVATMQKQYTYGPFVPTVTIEADIVIIDVDTKTILSQDADYNKVAALCETRKFDRSKVKQKNIAIDTNKSNYIIESIPAKRFSGNQVLAYYYVSL